MNKQNWIWRDGEIGFKTFMNLSKQEKEKHIEFLLNLDSDKLSTNDLFILEYYGIKNKSKNFLSLEDE